MYNVEGLTKNDIKEIYQSVIIYSLYRFQELPDILKSKYQTKYEQALTMKEKLGITEISNKENIKSFLETTKEQINSIQTTNQPIINMLATETLNILIEEKPKELTPLETCEYIFDYLTNTMEYANDWYNYCHKTPPTDGFDFSFYNGIPLSSSYEGLLITRQGVCEDFANLMSHLGKKMGLDIKTMICNHSDNMHAINYIELNNGQISLIDTTSVILKNKTKEEAFLVSEKVLNKENDYKFDNQEIELKNKILTSITIPKKEEKLYNINDIIDKTNTMLPTVDYIYLSEQKKNHQL